MVNINLVDLHQTELLGYVLARSCKPSDVYLLSGELGSGKTSICRSFLREFTRDYDMDVPSPSYLISLQYPAACEEKFLAYHIDPYRLSPGNVSCLVDFDTAASNDLLLIEWPSRLGEALSAAIDSKASRVLYIDFEGVGPQAAGRAVTLRTRSSDLEKEWLNAIVDQFEEAVNLSEKASKLPRLMSPDDSKTPSVSPIPTGSIQSFSSDMLVMGIESSCDDTAVAIVKGDGTIVAQAIASQAAIHAEWGGVVPKLAQEEHAKAIQGTVDSCLEKAGLSPRDLSAISVTVGPGLALCLLVGVKKAIELSAEYQLPLVRVHHMEAHMMMTRLPGVCDEVPEFPFVTLLVSGGHTMIVLTKDLGDHVILGSTIDDSVGEAFDKTARLLGIKSIPGGRELEALAAGGEAEKWVPQLPKPLSRTRDEALRKGCDMSFAGLKTSVRVAVETALAREQKEGVVFEKANLAAAFQKCCADHLADRLKKALEIVCTGTSDQGPLMSNVKHIVIAGGVAANQTVRRAVVDVAQSFALTVCVPPAKYCTDNGVMVAWTGIERLKRGLGEPAPRIKNIADAEMYSEARPRWPLGVRHSRCLGKINDSAGRPLDRKAQDMSKGKDDSLA